MLINLIQLMYRLLEKLFFTRKRFLKKPQIDLRHHLLQRRKDEKGGKNTIYSSMFIYGETSQLGGISQLSLFFL